MTTWPAAEIEAVVIAADPLNVVVAIPGPPGAARDSPVLRFQITSATNFSAVHPFTYVPRVTLLDALGNEVETDTSHVNGSVILRFPEPFTGSLTLS